MFASGNFLVIQCSSITKLCFLSFSVRAAVRFLWFEFVWLNNVVRATVRFLWFVFFWLNSVFPHQQNNWNNENNC